MKPVTIVGGGVAGLSLAHGLSFNGVPTTVIEASYYPRHRVCGEFFAGLQPVTLQVLHLGDLLESAVRCRSVSWYFGQKPVASFSLPDAVQGLSRFTLDHRLAEKFRALGGILQVGERVSDGRVLPEEGVVWASGKRNQGSLWLGLKCHCAGLALKDDLEMHVGKCGYVGLTRIENGQVNVCGLFRWKNQPSGGKDGLFRKALKGADLGELAARIAAAKIDPGSITAVRGFSFGVDLDRDSENLRQVRIGDAYGMIPPLTGNGMTMALESAAEVLPHLLAFCRGQHSWDKTAGRIREAQKQRFGQRLQFAVAMQWALENSMSRKGLMFLAKRRLLPFALLYRLLH